ncbi:MAG: SDR family NAD(P)-dependent oxidoreductase [Candidatus Electrothrix sp. EH2]|nr:SDR family NAD(P)-dependent oxidoreductase [Candidatus Electrothrix sp. EH2]
MLGSLVPRAPDVNVGFNKMKKIIIIGASSGIGKELAKIFSSNGYEIGVVARKINLLEELKSELPTKTYISAIDIKDTNSAIQSLDKLIKDMREVDIIVISSGIGHINPSLNWSRKRGQIYLIPPLNATGKKIAEQDFPNESNQP